MLLRTSGLLILFTVLCASSAGLLCAAQQAQPAAPVRYHFGDDPDSKRGWANRDFDDSAWPVAQQGQWPEPAFYSDGFVWVRFHIPVRSDTTEPLAIRVITPQHVLTADEVFVNGALVGRFGKVPPGEEVESLPMETVFDVPAGLTAPGAISDLTLRLWYPPSARRPGKFDTAGFVFDQRRTLHAEEEAMQERALVRNLPAMMLNGFILLLGIIVLLLGRSSRSRDLLLYGAMLASIPLITLYLEVVDARLVLLSVREFYTGQVLSQIPAMIISVEFIWRIHALTDVWFKRLALATLALFNLGILVTFAPSEPSGIVTVAQTCYPLSLQAFDVLTLGANLFVLFVKRRNRLIAVAMSFVPIASLLSGFRDSFHGGADLFDLAFFLAGLCLSAALALNAWNEWRARDALQAEFEAAREVQQRLVTPAMDVPGFAIESVYAPARQVGGDFFRILPDSNGSLLVVVGDVSGKGLKAAMTVSAVMGALPGCPSRRPAEVLQYLNHALFGQVGGFVTCCVSHIANDGAMSLANAGNPAPYRNGDEMAVEPGLPLGMLAEATYTETRYHIAPGDRLTFVSDGVLEATNAKGELYGFERTRSISNQAARTIAEAATQFGQEDDITVVTLRRENVGASARTQLSVHSVTV